MKLYKVGFSLQGFQGNLVYCVYAIVKFLFVDDIVASEDILGEIVLYKPLLENVIVYYIVGSLIYNNIIL